MGILVGRGGVSGYLYQLFAFGYLYSVYQCLFICIGFFVFVYLYLVYQRLFFVFVYLQVGEVLGVVVFFVVRFGERGSEVYFDQFLVRAEVDVVEDVAGGGRGGGYFIWVLFLQCKSFFSVLVFICVVGFIMFFFSFMMCCLV